jgi:hypothetical protein
MWLILIYGQVQYFYFFHYQAVIKAILSSMFYDQMYLLELLKFLIDTSLITIPKQMLTYFFKEAFVKAYD